MLKLSRKERDALEAQAQAQSEHGKESARHARLVLLLADGHTWAQIRDRLGCSDSYIARWSKRFTAERLAGLYPRHAGRERYKVTDKLERRVIEKTVQHTPADGSRHWSSRKLAAELGGTISHMTVARIWAKHGINPQRTDGAETLPDPAFNASAADIVGLYLNRPRHAAIFSVVDGISTAGEEASSNRSGMPGRPGMLALYRSLKGRQEEPPVPRAKRSGAAELAAFIASVVAQRDAGEETHVVADHAPSNRCRDMVDLLAAHPDIHLHTTSTYVSWMGQMDRALGKMELALIAAGASHQVRGLKTAMMQAIRRCNQRSTPVKWTYLR